MGRLDREPRPSRELLDDTLKFVAEIDNLDGEAYLLAREVLCLIEDYRALNERATRLYQELEAERLQALADAQERGG